jgi:ubiquitin-conjugating enzyme E2 variant
MISAILLADFITGFFHWFEDAYLPYCTNHPLFGNIAKDNVLHHYFPRAMLAFSTIEHCHYSLPATTLIAILLLYTFPRFVRKNAIFLIVLFVFINMANIIHSWSHMRKCELHPLVLFLQNHGVLVSHEHHRVHHQTRDTRYCVITPLMNGILDSICFWKGLERIVYMYTGVQPSHVLYGDFESIHTPLHKNAELCECPKKPVIKDVQELRNILQQYHNCPMSTDPK